MLIFGYLLIILTPLMLAFDRYILFGGIRITHSADIFDILMQFHKETISNFEKDFIANVFPDLRNYLSLPILKFSAALSAKEELGSW